MDSSTPSGVDVPLTPFILAAAAECHTKWFILPIWIFHDLV
jgi:hypothetical protein